MRKRSLNDSEFQNTVDTLINQVAMMNISSSTIMFFSYWVKLKNEECWSHGFWYV